MKATLELLWTLTTITTTAFAVAVATVSMNVADFTWKNEKRL